MTSGWYPSCGLAQQTGNLLSLFTNVGIGDASVADSGECDNHSCAALSVEVEQRSVRSRKWKRHEGNWAKIARQKQQNSGAEYQTAWGMGATADDCKWPIKCFQQVNSEYRQQIFDEFYALDSRDINVQNSYRMLMMTFWIEFLLLVTMPLQC